MFDRKQKLEEVISALGIYIVIILEVRFISKSNSVYFLVETEDGRKSEFYLNLQFLDGNRNDISYQLMRNLLDLLVIEDVDPDDRNHFVELEGKFIGVLLKPYINSKGIPKMNCMCWCDPETKQTSWEVYKDEPASHIDNKLMELKNMNVKEGSENDY